MVNRSSVTRHIGAAGLVICVAALMPSLVLGADAERPYRGSCSTIVTPLSPPGTFPLLLTIDSVCQLTHLGHSTGRTSQAVVPAGPQNGASLPLAISNATTYQAANGDQLVMLFSGSGTLNLVSGVVTFIGTEKYLGGTGRFAEAKGSSWVEGTASVFTNTGAFTVRGQIAY